MISNVNATAIILSNTGQNISPQNTITATMTMMYKRHIKPCISICLNINWYLEFRKYSFEYNGRPKYLIVVKK